MRIVLVSSSSGSRGGGEHYFQLLANGLVRAGHDVVMMCATHPRMDSFVEGLDAAVDVDRIQYPNTYDYRGRCLTAILQKSLQSSIRRRIGNHRPDVIHVLKQNLEDSLDLVLATESLASSCWTTIHVTRTASELGQSMSTVRDILSRHVLRQYRGGVIVTSHACRKQLQSFLGFRGPKPRVIHNGIEDNPQVSADKNGVHKLETDCGEDLCVRMVCLARLEPQKDPLFFLTQVMPLLDPRLHLTWIGDGYLRSQAEQAVAELGLQDRVELTGWCQNPRERLRDFDLFVLPSRYEGFPFSILEAMAAGLPTIAHDVDGNSEAIVDGETGVLIRPSDAAHWIATLNGPALDASQRLGWGVSGCELYSREFTVDRMVEKTLACYRSQVSCEARVG